MNLKDPLEHARAVLSMPCASEGEAMTLGEHAHRLAEGMIEIGEFIEARTDAPRVDDHGNLLSIVQRIGAMQAELVRVRAERDEAADEAKAADLHRNLNRRVAEALGLTDWQTDPETGEDYLPSWHDMPERVEELRLNLTAAERDLASARELLVEATAMLAAELGKPAGAPSARWTCDGRTWRGAREDGGIDKVEHYAGLNGDGTVRMARVWSEEDRFGFEKERGRFELARAAMIAADKAIGQPVQAPDLRPSNILLTLTPALQARIEALGYTPGETPAGVLPWLVAELEDQRGYSAMLEAIARPGPLITGFAPDAVNVRDRLLGWLITAYAMELKELTPEQAPNNLALAMSFPEAHHLHGYRVEMSVARPEKPTPREQLDEARKVLDEIRSALGNGADEDLWPPGKTLGEALKPK